MPASEKQIEHLRRIAKSGGDARAKAFTSDYQRETQAARSHESLSEAGKRGFAVNVKKHGIGKAMQHVNAYRRTHPSEPERWVSQVLTSAGFDFFQREYEFADDARTLDFAFPDVRVGIEVNGSQHYAAAFGETESRAARDSEKTAWLNERGWTVLVVNATADRQAESARLIESLKQYVSPQYAASLDRLTDSLDELPF